jgi:hypothetical protein
VGPDFRDAIGSLVAEEGAFGAVLRPLGAGQPAQIVGFGLGEVSRRQYRRGLTRSQTVAGDPAVSDPGILDKRHASLFVVERAVADIPAHQRLMQGCRQRDPIPAVSVGIAVNQPHVRVTFRR